MANRLFVVVGLSIFASAGAASAEDFLQNRWKPDQYLNIERGLIESTPIQMDWWSAMWAIEPVEGLPYVRLRNRWKPDQYLHIERGPLEAGQISPDWWSAMWTLQPAEGNFKRIQNRWKPDIFIHIEHGSVAAGPIQPDWWSAMWAIQPAPGTASATATATAPAPPAGIGESITCPAQPQAALPAGWSLQGDAKLSRAEVKKSIGTAQALVCTYAGADSARPLLVLEKAMPDSLACVVDPNSNSFSCR